MMRGNWLWTGFVLGFLSGCGPAFDPAAVPEARAGCEAPPAEVATNSRMLPGWDCLQCHRPEGQSARVFTAAGTVFAAPDAGCAGGGVAGAMVELIGPTGAVAATLMTNEVGNFYTEDALPSPLRVRVSKGNKSEEMLSTMGLAACGACHGQPSRGGAPGRVYLRP